MHNPSDKDKNRFYGIPMLLVLCIGFVIKVICIGTIKRIKVSVLRTMYEHSLIIIARS